jgi:hypothetical protein
MQAPSAKRRKQEVSPWVEEYRTGSGSDWVTVTTSVVSTKPDPVATASGSVFLELCRCLFEDQQQSFFALYEDAGGDLWAGSEDRGVGVQSTAFRRALRDITRPAKAGTLNAVTPA